MILYFSATGNTKYLAENLGEIFNDEVVSLFSYIKANEKADFFSEKPYVLVSPTYGWRVPRFLSQYLKNCKFSGNKNFYTIMDFGNSAGNSQKYHRKLIEDKGLTYRGIYGIQMPENYLMLFDLDSEQRNREILSKAKYELLKALKFISENRDFPKANISMMDKILSSIVNDVFFKFIVKDKKFYYTDKCTKCGRCKKVCVLNNITYEKGYPKWNGNCTHCAACISKCPYGAIEYGKKTIGKDRYLLSKLLKDVR